jgi:cytochrome P450
LNRYPGEDHFVYGGLRAGIHHCLGVHLARLGLRVAIGEWLSAIPVYETEPGFSPTLVAWEAERLAGLPLRWVG